MTIPAYPHYKAMEQGPDIQIPSHWALTKLRFEFSFGRGLTITKNNLVDEGVPCVSYGEVHSKHEFQVNPETDKLKCVDDSYLKSCSYALLNKGDFVYADTSEDIDGAGNFTQLISDSLIFAGYHTIIARPLQNDAKRFLAYLLDSQEFRNQIRLSVKGVKVFSVTQAILKASALWLPPIHEQTQIARFLDHETAKIDALIAEQKRLIKLLQEKRQAVISHAVTKGLDPNVPMKDSGIEWLGEVPTHWEVTPIRRLIHDHKQGYYTTEKYVDDGVKLLRITDLDGRGGLTTNICPKVPDVTGVRNYLLEQGDVVFARTGGAGLFGVFEESERVAFASYLIRFNFNKSLVNIKFLRQFLLSNSFQTQIELQIHGGVNKNVHAEDIKNSFMTVPPMVEQCLISQEVEQTELMFDNLMGAAEKSIALMSERRSALISAAVTGKIDVRDWQSPADESAFDKEVQKAGMEASA